jgi:hypothetical protein
MQRREEETNLETKPNALVCIGGGMARVEVGFSPSQDFINIF